jgi:hypothetical protein
LQACNGCFVVLVFSKRADHEGKDAGLSVDQWIMLGIVVFVMLGQAVLWSWVFIMKRQVAPDVRIFNWAELRAWLLNITARRRAG